MPNNYSSPFVPEQYRDIAADDIAKQMGIMPNANYQYTPGNLSTGDRRQLQANLLAGHLQGGLQYDPQTDLSKYRAVHKVGHTGIGDRIGHALSQGAQRAWSGFTDRRARTNLWPLFAAAAAGGAFSSGAAGGSGVGSAVAPGASAATVDPFLTNAGLGTGWTSIGGTSAFPTTAGIGAGAAPTTISPGLAGAPAGATGTPWYNTFGGQTALNTGFNMLGGWLQNRAISSAQQQSQQQIADRIRQALAALSPEQIMALAQQFLPQMAAQMSGAGQTAIQAVREQAARTGQLEGPRALSFEAGTRAKLASDVQQRAFEAAFNTAGAQAGAITGAPYTPIQPQTGFADAITNSINQAYMARALSQRPQYPTGVPYQWPGQFGGPY